MAAKKKAKKKAAKKPATKKRSVSTAISMPVPSGTGITTSPISGAFGGTVGLDQGQGATEVEQPGESPVIEEEEEDFTSGSDLEEDFEDED